MVLLGRFGRHTFALAVPRTVNGQWDLPGDGQQSCPLAAKCSAHRLVVSGVTPIVWVA